MDAGVLFGEPVALRIGEAWVGRIPATVQPWTNLQASAYKGRFGDVNRSETFAARAFRAAAQPV